ncbi:MAG TPA: porin [Vicinamibacteria bacterium]|nr:porin [Vicinamibacteria bacterium]HRB12559.1 porin [Vicinamibacteria bacterium]
MTHLKKLFAALLCLAAFATSALAQGMFYKEVAKDGRIYVFNLGPEYERWAQTGETGRAITKLNYGPNGETVVFDSEEAIDLYNFKHGVAEVVTKPKPPRLELVWRDGKTRITTDSAYLEMSTRLQMRYTHELPDDAVQLAGTAAKGDDKGSFRIRRAKFKLEGWAMKPWLTYEFQINIPAVSGSNAGAILEDASIDVDVTKGKNKFRVKFGQFKPSFGRQEMTSSGSQSFVDRAEVSNIYARGRETGLALWGTTANNKLEWRAGISNGNSMTRTTNDNDAFQYNARVMFQPTGRQALAQRAWVSGPFYSEGDFESGDFPLFAIAANFEKNDFHRATTGNDLKDTIFGFDLVYKYKRFFATGEYYIRERTPETGAKFNSDGFFGQATYMLTSRRQWEIGARYGQYDPSDLLPLNKRTELRGALSYYYGRHNLKVQADFGQLKTEAAAGSIKNMEFRLQSQIVF